MTTINYYRVSTKDQSIESQRQKLGPADREFSDEGVSGGVPAEQRPGFAQLLAFVRDGDVIRVYALDRLGRDALDVQKVVRGLIARGVTLDIHGIGQIAKGVGEIIVAVLAQVADLERQRINERAEAGREAARKSLAATGKTHRGKLSLGQSPKADASVVIQWRKDNQASISATAKHFGLSDATVKRYAAAVRG
ncbi:MULTISPECIES: recombinase family protein [Ralstonia solanacearum species complex]|uniref:Resolvase n=3 Tax=Ralstonia solanacearum species complex TaxID=3116862 RepID=A0AB33VBB6_RALSU|nr:recombinase family protein [Ralstonia solanacearum]ALF88471.1 Putative DNA-invertase from lambdoid prophage Rac [Ralstonia solanacearum]ATI27921.1 resolvase [Ralstonia solanacearum]ATJ86677.1 resolvase [Ralstonia solanacearum]EAP72193.1 Putative resolvase [Ralstonia solanacearum UW551]KEI30751.1 resolvase [Ralstonia solanacearum]